jgi:hypothetical protein
VWDAETRRAQRTVPSFSSECVNRTLRSRTAHHAGRRIRPAAVTERQRTGQKKIPTQVSEQGRGGSKLIQRSPSVTKSSGTHRQFCDSCPKAQVSTQSASIAQRPRLYLRNQDGESMGSPRERERKHLSARIKICGTGKSVDDSVWALID